MFDQIPITGMATCYARKTATLQKLLCLSTLLASQFVLSRMRIFCDAAPFWPAARLGFGVDPMRAEFGCCKQLFGDQRDTNQRRVTSAVLSRSLERRESRIVIRLIKVSSRTHSDITCYCLRIIISISSLWDQKRPITRTLWTSQMRGKERGRDAEMFLTVQFF